jgi:hypothetical protein
MKNTPAFPVFPETGGGHASAFHGMTLRDYFASKAMQAQVSIFENAIALAREQIKLEDVCIASYEVADAMLKARTDGL